MPLRANCVVDGHHAVTITRHGSGLAHVGRYDSEEAEVSMTSISRYMATRTSTPFEDLYGIRRVIDSAKPMVIELVRLMGFYARYHRGHNNVLLSAFGPGYHPGGHPPALL